MTLSRHAALSVEDDCNQSAPTWLAAVGRGGREREPAAHRLFKCFYGILVRYLRVAFQFDLPTAEDVAQTALIKAFNAARSFAGRAAFKTWLINIARNAARDYLRKESGRPDRPAQATGDPSALHEDEADAPVESASGLEDYHLCIDRQFAQFCKDHPLCGEALRRFYYEGWSSKDLAAARGKRDDAMRTELKVCRQNLRTYLAACQKPVDE